MDETKDLKEQDTAERVDRNALRDLFVADRNNLDSKEILKMMLAYAIPLNRVNAVAEELLQTFPSVSAVMQADIIELMEIKGMNKSAAVLFNIIPQLCHIYELDKIQNKKDMRTTQQLKTFIRARLIGLPDEHFLLLCLNKSRQMICCEEMSRGTVNATALNIQQIIKCAVQHKSFYIVMAHNHPRGEAEFSDDDFFATDQVRLTMDKINVKLLDHIVIGKDGSATSMREDTDCSWSLK